MRVDIVLTTRENGQFVEKVIDHTHVRRSTDFLELHRSLARKHFGERHRVRPDRNLFGWVAVSSDGDTIHIQ